MEILASDWMEQHPEYHALLENPAGALEQDYTPERGETNPFLHLSMHLSISEQISIDQPLVHLSLQRFGSRFKHFTAIIITTTLTTERTLPSLLTSTLT